MKRHKKSRFSWFGYIAIFIVLGISGILPPLLFGGSAFLALPATKKYLLWYLLYWIGISLIFSFIMAYQKYMTLDKPMNELSKALERVADGDFSIYLKPLHRAGKKDYLDDLFQDFNQMVEELASTETLKNDFIADVSHEIKTPLAIIQNYITALQDENIPKEKKQQYMDTIFDSTKRLTELVSNILKLNKLENQKIVPKSEPYNLGRQLCDCILHFENLIDKKKIEVKVDLEEHVMLNADESIMEVVWNNLLSNAVKFTDTGGQLSIRQISDESKITVRVEDTGCGMNAETMRHIFDKFYQGDTSHATEGNGLGMALVVKSINMIGGTIQVESELGKGTAFIIELKR